MRWSLTMLGALVQHGPVDTPCVGSGMTPREANPEPEYHINDVFRLFNGEG